MAKKCVGPVGVPTTPNQPSAKVVIRDRAENTTIHTINSSLASRGLSRRFSLSAAQSVLIGGAQ